MDNNNNTTTTTPTIYSHAFDFAFAISTGEADSNKVSVAEIREAAITRMTNLSDDELREACYCFDTSDEG